MNSPAHDVALYLVSEAVAAALGGADAWGAHVDSEPGTPDDVITIYNTGGGGPDTDQMDIHLPTFQVRVRGTDPEAVYAKQEAIRDLFIPTAETVLASSVVRIFMISDILALGRDDSNRHLLTANYRMRRVASG